MMQFYEYDSAHPPFNPFNDLQPAKGTARAEDGRVSVAMSANSTSHWTSR